MILASVARLAERVMGTTPPLYAWRPARWTVHLEADGRFAALVGDDTAHPHGPGVRVEEDANALDHLINTRHEQTPWAGRGTCCPMNVRTTNVEARLLADNAEYALGHLSDGADPAAVANRAKDFGDTVAGCLAGLRAAGADPAVVAAVAAVAAFAAHYPRRLPGLGPAAAAAIDRMDLVVFAVRPGDAPGGDFRPIPMTDSAVVRVWREWCEVLWQRRANPVLTPVPHQCLVCGQSRPTLKRWPQSLKGVPEANGTGAALSSANTPAFWSWGWEFGHNAPVCLACGDTLARAFNDLCRSDYLSVQVGNSKLIFWDHDLGSADLKSLFHRPTAETVRDLAAAAQGLPLSPADAAHAARVDAPPPATGEWDAVFLRGRQGRVAITSHHRTTLAAVRQNLLRWFRMQGLVDRRALPDPPLPLEGYWADEGRGRGAVLPDDANPPPPRRRGGRRKVDGLLESLAVPKRGVVSVAAIDPPDLEAFLRAALLGLPLPVSFLGRAAERCVAAGATRPRIAVICLALASRAIAAGRPEGEVMDATRFLDPQLPYRLGRALALADLIQAYAIGRPPAAPFSARFLGAVESQPAVMTHVGRLVNHHLHKLRRMGHGGLAYTLGGEFAELMPSEFPGRFDKEEYGMFMCGFYHRTFRTATGAGGESSTTPPVHGGPAADGATNGEG